MEVSLSQFFIDLAIFLSGNNNRSPFHNPPHNSQNFVLKRNYGK